MIAKITHIPVFVHDQDAALTFYTQKLGLDLHTDVTIEDSRWLTVCPKNQPEMEIVLTQANTPEQKALVGKQSPDMPLYVFATDNCQKTYEELKARGVIFISEPEEKPWGIEALFKDLYGNIFDLCQPKEG